MSKKHEVKGQVIAIMHSGIHKIWHTCTNKVGYQHIVCCHWIEFDLKLELKQTLYIHLYISFANHLICIFMNIHKTYPLSLTDFSPIYPI